MHVPLATEIENQSISLARFPTQMQKYGVIFYIVHVHLQDSYDPNSSLLHTCFSLYLDLAILHSHLLRFRIFRSCMYRSISSHFAKPPSYLHR